MNYFTNVSFLEMKITKRKNIIYFPIFERLYFAISFICAVQNKNL